MTGTARGVRDPQYAPEACGTCVCADGFLEDGKPCTHACHLTIADYREMAAEAAADAEREG